MANEKISKLVSRGADSTPTVTVEAIRRAEELRLHIVNIICDEPGAEVGDDRGVSFVALVAFLPRLGDRIELENGRLCEVKRAYFKIVKSVDASGDFDAFVLVPNVFAVLLGK